MKKLVIGFMTVIVIVGLVVIILQGRERENDKKEKVNQGKMVEQLIIQEVAMILGIEGEANSNALGQLLLEELEVYIIQIEEGQLEMTVKCTVKNRDVVKAFNSIPADEEMTMADYEKRLLASVKLQNKITEECMVHLIKQNDNWQVQADEVLVNACTGGFLRYLEDNYGL